MKGLQQDVKTLTHEVKTGNQLQIYLALLFLSPIPLLFWFGYKKIGECWRQGDVYGRVLAILCVALALHLTVGVLYLADIYLF